MTMLNNILRGGVLLAVGLSVAACGPKRDNPTAINPPGAVVVVQQEDQFGTRFGTAFRADNNSEPYSPVDGDIVAISFTTEPIEIK